VPACTTCLQFWVAACRPATCRVTLFPTVFCCISPPATATTCFHLPFTVTHVITTTTTVLPHTRTIYRRATTVFVRGYAPTVHGCRLAFPFWIYRCLIPRLPVLPQRPTTALRLFSTAVVLDCVLHTPTVLPGRILCTATWVPTPPADAPPPAACGVPTTKPTLLYPPFELCGGFGLPATTACLCRSFAYLPACLLRLPATACHCCHVSR